MNRRTAVKIGAASLAALSIPSAYYLFANVEYDRGIARPGSLSLIWDDEAIRKIGTQFRSQHLDNESERSLASSILDSKLSDQAITQSIETKIKTDFENKNTVIVDGWVLSETEARQCALFSIPQSK